MFDAQSNRVRTFSDWILSRRGLLNPRRDDTYFVSVEVSLFFDLSGVIDGGRQAFGTSVLHGVTRGSNPHGPSEEDVLSRNMFDRLSWSLG